MARRDGRARGGSRTARSERPTRSRRRCRDRRCPLAAEFGAGPRGARRPVGWCRTLGACHAGTSRSSSKLGAFCESVVVTDLRQPMQFAPTEDLAVYPRTLAADLADMRAGRRGRRVGPVRRGCVPGRAAQVSGRRGRWAPAGGRGRAPRHFAGVLLRGEFLGWFARRWVLRREGLPASRVITRMGGRPRARRRIAGGPPSGGGRLARSSRNVSCPPRTETRALTLSRAHVRRRAAAGGGAEQCSRRRPRSGRRARRCRRLPRAARRRSRPGAPQGSPGLLVAARVGTTRLIDNVEVVL